MRRRGVRLLPLLLAATALACEAGDTLGDTGIGEVRVVLRGNVVDAADGAPIEGIHVTLVRVLPDAASESVVEIGTTDAEGRFGPSDTVAIEPEAHHYALRLTDPAGRYFEDESTVVFALTDAELDYRDLRMTPREIRARSDLAATLLDARTDAPLAGVQVTIAAASGDEAPRTVESDAEGEIRVADLPLGRYVVTWDGSAIASDAAPDGYVVETEVVSLQPGPLNDRGSVRLMPRSRRLDLAVVTSWRFDDDPHFEPIDLDVAFSLPGPDFDFNHLLGAQLAVEPTQTATPASGFAAGTAYWPRFLGGEPGDPGRVRVDAGSPAHRVGDVDVVTLDRTSDDGREPEVLTFHRRNPMTALPADLAYHYVDEGVRRFPVGMGVLTVTWRSGAAGLFGSDATVKVYQGEALVGRFALGELDLPPGEGGRRVWTPFLVEYGFTSPSPAGDDDVYFRLVPLAGIDRRVDARTWPYEAREAAAAGLAAARAGAVHDDRLYVAGADADDGHGLWVREPADDLAPDAAAAGGWRRLTSDEIPAEFEVKALATWRGSLVVGGVDHRPGHEDEGALRLGADGPTSLGPCGPVRAMLDAGGALYLGTPAGLRLAGICGDRQLESQALRDAPRGDIRALTAFTFGLQNGRPVAFLLAGGEGTGLQAGFVERQRQGGRVRAVARWGVDPPGREGSPIPGGATITALGTWSGLLLVGTADGGLRVTDGFRWADDPAGVIAPGGGRPEGDRLPATDGDGAPVVPVAFAEAHGALYVATSAGLWQHRPPRGGAPAAWTRLPLPDVDLRGLVPHGEDLYVLTGAGLLRVR